MGYQRANWHSGLTYRQICETCKATVTYTDHELDFRPWYADGFVDCQICGSHLRHNEKYALPVIGVPNVAAPQQAPVGTTSAPLFCHNCGTKFGEGHRFCAKCGTKRN